MVTRIESLSGVRKKRVARVAPKGGGGVSMLPPESGTMGAILEDYAQALSMVVVCQRSLAAQELAAVGDEEATLREAIRLLRQVYAGLDGLSALYRL